jgi:hypothetical protein
MSGCTRYPQCRVHWRYHRSQPQQTSPSELNASTADIVAPGIFFLSLSLTRQSHDLYFHSSFHSD